MQMSNRITGFQCSPIRRLVPYSRLAGEKGIHVIHLNIGQPDIKTPKEAIDAIHSYDKDIIEYGISEGEVPLRRGLVHYYSKYGLSVNEEDIMITTGGSEAIQFVLMTLCDPFDEFIIPEPFYTNVSTFANIAMVTLRPVTSSSEDNFVLPSIDEFEKCINKKTMGILLCSPNNPTGHVYTREELRALLELCRRHDIFLVVDEVYREFCYDGKSFTSVLSFPEYQDRVICIDSFSKRFSMCGARVGAIVSRNREVIDSAMKLAQARLCPPAVEQVAAAAALTAPDEYVEKVSLPVDDAEKFAIFMLRDFSYDGCTVMIAPAEGFYVTPGLGYNQARIAYVLKESELIKAAKCLEEGLKVYRREVMGIRN